MSTYLCIFPHTPAYQYAEYTDFCSSYFSSLMPHQDVALLWWSFRDGMFFSASFNNSYWWATHILMADQVCHVSNRVSPSRASPGISIFIGGPKGVLTLLIIHNPRSRWLLIVLTFEIGTLYTNCFLLALAAYCQYDNSFKTLAGTCSHYETVIYAISNVARDDLPGCY